MHAQVAACPPRSRSMRTCGPYLCAADPARVCEDPEDGPGDECHAPEHNSRAHLSSLCSEAAWNGHCTKAASWLLAAIVNLGSANARRGLWGLRGGACTGHPCRFAGALARAKEGRCRATLRAIKDDRALPPSPWQHMFEGGTLHTHG